MGQAYRLPDDRPLSDLTAELTVMLGDPDPRVRDETGYATLATWLSEGVYDGLLEGLGDGMVSGLAVGLGEQGTDTVFRRSFSALVLAGCVRRAVEADLLPGDVLLRWGDRLVAWLLRERDLRGFVPGRGWAHALAHGADALGALAQAPALGPPELVTLLDVVADRLLVPTEARLMHGEDDRLAAATLEVLRRDLVGLDVLTSWVARLVAGAQPAGEPGADPFRVSGNVASYLRALHLQLVLAPRRPACRADLLLVLLDGLRSTTAPYLS